jgi:hypothetical protein
LQEAAARLKGSGLVEIAAYDAAAVAALAASTAGTDSISWKNIGSVEALALKEDMVSTQLKGDNALEEKYVSEQKLTVSFNQREAASEDVRTILRGAFDVSGTPVAAAQVVGYTGQAYAANETAADTFYPFTMQNGNGAVPTTISIVQDAAVTPVTLAAGTDYTVTKANGLWGVTFIAGGDYDPTKTEALTYTYTPYASQTTYSGGKTTLPYVMIRITNTDEDGKLVRFWAYKGAIDGGWDLAFKKDDDADPIVPNPVSMTFILDTSIATLGKQLWKWYQDRGIL